MSLFFQISKSIFFQKTKATPEQTKIVLGKKKVFSEPWYRIVIFKNVYKIENIFMNIWSETYSSEPQFYIFICSPIDAFFLLYQMDLV